MDKQVNDAIQQKKKKRSRKIFLLRMVSKVSNHLNVSGIEFPQGHVL